MVVLNRVTYHTALEDDDRWPITSWNKSRLSNAIIRRGDAIDDCILTCRYRETKEELLHQTQLIYKIQKFANRENVVFNINTIFSWSLALNSIL